MQRDCSAFINPFDRVVVVVRNKLIVSTSNRGQLAKLMVYRIIHLQLIANLSWDLHGWFR
jgi:hypothetical protein